MPAYFRLQDLNAVSGVATQRLEEAVDVGRYGTVVAQMRKASFASAGTAVLQHSATLEENAFVDVASPTFDLTATANEVQVFTNLLRYVRWRVPSITGSCQFVLDLVAREE